MDSHLDEEDINLEEELEVVPASYNSHNLVFLDKYTKYRIQILAFNPAGDGPRSKPITVKTLQVSYSVVLTFPC
jgi:protein sidekick